MAGAKQRSFGRRPCCNVELLWGRAAPELSHCASAEKGGEATVFGYTGSSQAPERWA